jgi:hypothetical protein
MQTGSIPGGETIMRMNTDQEGRVNVEIEGQRPKTLYRGKADSIPRFLADRLFERAIQEQFDKLRSGNELTSDLIVFEGNCRVAIWKMLYRTGR